MYYFHEGRKILTNYHWSDEQKRVERVKTAPFHLSKSVSHDSLTVSFSHKEHPKKLKKKGFSMVKYGFSVFN